MKEMTKLKGLSAIKNIGHMTIAQLFVMVLSIGMSVFVPKFVGISEFSYWQLFIFYASYTGCLHFGLNDGIYLKQGGKQMNDNDKINISNQLWFSIAFQCIMLLGLYSILSFTNDSVDRKIIYLYICIYAIVNNIFNYCGSVLQSINHIKNYSKYLLIDKIFVILYIFVILLCHRKDYDFLIWGYIGGRSLALSILLYNYRPIFLCSLSFKKNVIRKMFSNVAIGYNLMIANIASAFILGVGRFVVDIHYPIEVFGKVSFAFTLTGFVLALISQVGNSVFPILASKGKEFHKKLFPSLEAFLQLLLPICYLAYPIIYSLIYFYLPQYNESLSYFIILFPLCVFEAKISMLYNTYMKVLRLEHKLLVINLLSVSISAILVLLSYHIFQSIYSIIMSLVIAVLFKSFYLNYVISQYLDIKMENIFRDLTVSIICVTPLLIEVFTLYHKFIILIISISIYELFFYKELKSILKKIFVR